MEVAGGQGAAEDKDEAVSTSLLLGDERGGAPPFLMNNLKSFQLTNKTTRSACRVR